MDLKVSEGETVSAYRQLSQKALSVGIAIITIVARILPKWITSDPPYALMLHILMFSSYKHYLLSVIVMLVKPTDKLKKTELVLHKNSNQPVKRSLLQSQ